MKLKHKEEHLYIEFSELAEDIMEDILVDIIDFKIFGKDHYFFKIFVENGNTTILESDRDGFISFLESKKENILANPFLCPFCNTKEPEDVCENCKATFKTSMGYTCNSYIEKLTDYDGFSDFIRKIHKKTSIEYDILKNYILLKGNIEDIIDGAAVIYEGESSFPTFCLSKKIKEKELNKLDDKVLRRLVVANYLYKKENCMLDDFSDNKNIYEPAISLSNDIAFSFNNVDFILNEEPNMEKLFIHIKPDISIHSFLDDIDSYSEEDLSSLDEEYEECFINKMSDFNYYFSYVVDEYYYSKEIKYPDFSEKSNLESMVLLFEDHINEIIEKSYKYVDICIDNTVKTLENE